MKRFENKYIFWGVLIALWIGVNLYKYSHLGFAQSLMTLTLLSLAIFAYVGVFTFVMKYVFGAKEVGILSMLNRFVPKPAGTMRATIIAAVIIVFFFWLISGYLRAALNAVSLLL